MLSTDARSNAQAHQPCGAPTHHLSQTRKFPTTLNPNPAGFLYFVDANPRLPAGYANPNPHVSLYKLPFISDNCKGLMYAPQSSPDQQTREAEIRVSTDLTEQISRRFPGYSRRDLKKNPGHVCIVSARYVMYRMNYI